MDLTVDLGWLLSIQESKLAGDLAVRDYSALAAAVSRHRFNDVALEHNPDTAWRAAALLHTVVQLQPLPARNNLYACMIAIAYMDAAGEAIDPPYGALVQLVRDIFARSTDVFAAAERLRAWRV